MNEDKGHQVSTVCIIKDEYKDLMNACAEAYGCGPDNMSVKLKDSEGNVYWGCHSWWFSVDIETIQNRDLRLSFLKSLEVDNEDQIIEAFYKLHFKPYEGSSTESNWENSLQELGLTLY